MTAALSIRQCGSRRAASHRGNNLPRAEEDLSLDDWSARDETVDNHDHSDDEQDVDQSPTHMDDEESENPKDEKNNRDGPKHDGILARSE
jgi:hypothetical protein